MKLDVLVFAAHPDDAELFCGGSIAKMINQGYRVGIVDLTQGELGSRGSASVRKQEAGEAAKILGINVRENALIPDGNIELTPENRLRVIRFIRKYRPAIVFAPYREDRHPDHAHASQLVSEACFYSGLVKIETGQSVHRPKQIIYYLNHDLTNPSFVADISDFFGIKLKAIKAYQSQFYSGKKSDEPETFISSKAFWDFIETRARFYGNLAGVRYGEPFFTTSVIKIDNIFKIFA